MVLIYATTSAPRIDYIARFLFTDILGVPVSVTTSQDEYKYYQGPKINYSSIQLGGLAIQPQKLLFEQGVNTVNPGVSNVLGVPVLFPVYDSPLLPFDPFAAAFFMVSRYEEYLPLPIDKHKRALPQATVAFQEGFLQTPVVDHWALMLRDVIQKEHPGYFFPERKYRFIPTIDVDVAYAYLYRNNWRTLGAALKAMVKMDWANQKLRFQTLAGHRPDPFDTYDTMHELHQKFGLEAIFFFLVGKYGKYDKNLSHNHPAIRQLIAHTHQKSMVGIHPSYQSNEDANLMQQEISHLRDITGVPISRSRQHFLRLKLPDTYRQLINYGITQDYTMGWASQPGFRAGTCTPFPFYDLISETETPLIVYPFQVMDGTLNQYMKLSPIQAIECIQHLVDEVRKVNGTFISLWHNESLSGMRSWQHWGEVYHQLVAYASKST